jgi:hypothetical protein
MEAKGKEKVFSNTAVQTEQLYSPTVCTEEEFIFSSSM